MEDFKIPEGSTIIKFYADWCSPCSELSKALESKEYQDVLEENEVEIVNINADDNPELMEQFSIKSLPAMLFIKDFDVKLKLTGKQSILNLERFKKGIELIK